MASSSFYSSIIFLISCSMGTTCSTQKFGANQKVLIEYFYDGNTKNDDILSNITDIILESNGLVSLKQRVGAEVTQNYQGLLDCGRTDCITDRKIACLYKSNPNKFDDAIQHDDVKMDSTRLGICVCDGTADNILLENGAARVQYNIPVDKLPAVVVGGQYDPCLQPADFDAMKTFFCTAYDNVLPVCK